MSKSNQFMGFIFRPSLAFLAMVCGLAIAGAVQTPRAHAAEPAVIRYADLDFAARPEFLSKGNLEYYYQLLNKDSGEQDEKDSFSNRTKAAELLFKLDTDGARKKALASGDKIYVLTAKVASVAGKDLSFFVRHALDENYLRALLPKVGIRKQGKEPGLFVAEGSTWVPTATLRMELIKPENYKAIQNPGLLELLQLDRGLGEPALIVTQHYSDFGTKFWSKTSAMSRTVSKYYPITIGGLSRTLIIDYTISYLYNVPPQVFGWGGTESIRNEATAKAFEMLEVINRY